MIDTSPSPQASPVPPAPTSTAADYSLNRVAKVLLLRSIGMAASVQVLEAAAEPHERLDTTALVLDLKSPSVRPESIRAFAELNYRFLLGAREGLAEAPSQFQSHRRYRDLLSTVDAALVKLQRDLCVPIRRGEMVLLDGFTPEQVRALVPMRGLPRFSDVPEIATLALIIAGSGIGAAIQATRQHRTFGLHGGENGGAEYLNSFGKPTGQIVRVMMEFRRLNPLFKVVEAQARAQQTSRGIFSVLCAEFESKWRDMTAS